MDQAKIGSFLKQLRKEKNLTQEQFAEKLGISGRTVSRWENGNNMPDISLLAEIAEFYEVSIPEIINGERKSEIMKEEVKEVAEKMSDYAGAEKTGILKQVRNLSLMGVLALLITLILDVSGAAGAGGILGMVHLYAETLVYVSVAMIFLHASGLLYKLRRRNAETSLPRPLLIGIAVVGAFVIALVLKLILNQVL